jgi:site-specific DNA recombinase
MSKHLRPPSAMNGAVRAVIYARYSSENQREASIEDQVRICKARIDAEGWNLVATYTDHAQSGASHLRSGYQKLLADGRAGLFDVVFAEALDRLSRDQEHVAALFKHLSFAGVKIFTLAEGEISALHVGLKGTMNAPIPYGPSPKGLARAGRPSAPRPFRLRTLLRLQCSP